MRARNIPPPDVGKFVVETPVAERLQFRSPLLLRRLIKVVVEDLFGRQGMDDRLVVLSVHPWKVYIVERCHEMRPFGKDKTAAVDEVDDAPFSPAPCREALSRFLAASLPQILE
jgi:hypothetical protein